MSNLIQYDLISSPTLLNGLLKRQVITGKGGESTTRSYTPSAADSQLKSETRPEGRGCSRRSTTLLDESLPLEDIERIKETRRLVREREETLIKLGSETRRLMTQSMSSASELNANQVSIYSGPLHNNRVLSNGNSSNSSLADKLAHARMLSKSGYNWDQNAACAKIRLGDGAILQNLYPSHSHVKLRNGRIERIDSYTQRFMQDQNLLREVTLIKEYEYNQWARTKPLNERERNTNNGNKAIPVELMESKSTQPTWDTLRGLSMNSSTILGMKNPIFSYDDLASKFASPKFLKRLGFIDDESDYNPINVCMPSEPEGKVCLVPTRVTKITTSVVGKRKQNDEDRFPEKLGLPPEIIHASESKEELEVNISDSIADVSELSSDDEEYRIDMDIQRPERIPSSVRTSRQRLAIYNDDSTIGRRSALHRPSSSRHSNDALVLPTNEQPDKSDDRYIVDIDDVRPQMMAISNLNLHSEEKHYKVQVVKNQLPPPKMLKKSKSYKLDIMSSLYAEKKFVPFSQPVCLCPKLSKETLGSLYSPIMQHYLAISGKRNLKCKLHNNSSVIMKSL